MKLNRRFKRNIKNSLSFYISASLLTAISVFLLVIMYTTVLMITQGVNEVMEKGNVEEAQFTTYNTIDGDGIKELEDKFNVELEQIHCVDIEEDGYTLRVFVPTKKIDRYEILEGKDIAADNEILLNRSFALEKDILIGDSFKVGGKKYTVVGFAVRPDYIYAQKDTSDFYLDKAMFGQVTMSETAFGKLEHTQSYYTIVYHENNNDEVRQYIYKNYFTLSYMSADSNNRIGMAQDMGKETGIMVSMIIPVMFAMISVIVAVVLGRKIRKEQKQIGTLAALGYRKKEIIKHYAIYAAIPGIIGSVIGIVLGVVYLKPVCIYFATDYEQINYDIKVYWTAVLIGAFVPTILYMVTTIITVIRMLQKCCAFTSRKHRQ